MNLGNMKNMIGVRPATLEDWPALTRLDQLIFGSYGAEEDPAIIRARLEVFPDGCVLLEERRATTDGQMVTETLGYLTTEKWLEVRDPVLNEDPHETHRPEGTILNITTLAIAPAHQNRGLGARLVEQAVLVAQRNGCTHIVLETAHAVTFYERHHFVQIGERLQRDIPLHIMLYDLSTAPRYTEH